MNSPMSSPGFSSQDVSHVLLVLLGFGFFPPTPRCSPPGPCLCYIPPIHPTRKEGEHSLSSWSYLPRWEEKEETGAGIIAAFPSHPASNLVFSPPSLFALIYLLSQVNKGVPVRLLSGVSQ